MTSGVQQHRWPDGNPAPPQNRGIRSAHSAGEVSARCSLTHRARHGHESWPVRRSPVPDHRWRQLMQRRDGLARLARQAAGPARCPARRWEGGSSAHTPTVLTRGRRRQLDFARVGSREPDAAGAGAPRWETGQQGACAGVPAGRGWSSRD